METHTGGTDHNNPTRSRRSLARVAGVVVACVVLTTVGSLVTLDAAEQVDRATFGCPSTAVMVISNTNCGLGGADAYDQVSLVDAPPTEETGASRAPWCAPVEDVTIYGCAGSGERPAQCLATSPAMHPDRLALTNASDCDGAVAYLHRVARQIREAESKAAACKATNALELSCIP